MTIQRVIAAAAFAATFVSAVPAFAQVDLSGEWSPVREEDNTGNPELGDWGGMPMNDAGRHRSMAWAASIQTLPEWQCRPHAATYISRGPSQLRIWKEVDPVSRDVTAWHMEWLRSVSKPVYMDGRPRPSVNAPHTWGGFSLGEWQGDIFKFTTTHIKEEYLKRNGVWHSDQATVTNFLIRRGNYLTWVMIERDPAYLSEPVIRTTEYQIDQHHHMPPYPCNVVEEIDRPRGVVPHHQPSSPRFLEEVQYFAEKYNIPFEAVASGAETMYPEIVQKIEKYRKAAPANTPRRPQEQ